MDNSERPERLVWVQVGRHTFIRMTEAQARVSGFKMLEQPEDKMLVPHENKRRGRPRRVG